jgi:glycyl-tRNA synthetase beta chain
VSEYLLEVRVEEIPARMLPAATKEIATRVFEQLMALGLGPAEVETGFTPRRLLLVMKGLPAREPDHEETLWGPPAQAAYDAAGNPTPALFGFAKRCGVESTAVGRAPKDKGEYLRVVRTRKGRATADVLAEVVPKTLQAVTWAKTMRWGAGAGPWVRPVHGVVSLLDGVVVPFEFFGIAAGDATSGHPILSPVAFRVENSADYRAKLQALGIEVRADRRRETLAKRIAARATELGGVVVEDEDLLAKLAAICEIPGVMEGALRPEVMALPREVLTTSLRDHQSAFTVASGDELLPVFFTVMDRADDPTGRVRSGNEWVVAARLADARFFYSEDRKSKLAERLPRLDQLAFHEKLGSYGEKCGRLARLADHLCVALGWESERAAAQAACALLKLDLTTEMVKEFTSLQGIMGGIYAREDGAEEPVWQAVYDQYLPAATGDRLPRGRVGLAVGLADRLDTLVGMFGLGLVPTGSRDPFGLRRAAQGALRIALEGGLSLDLAAAAKFAVACYPPGRLKRSADEILGDLRPFFADRLRYLLGLQGYAYDEIEAGLGAGSLDLPDLRARVDAFHLVRGEPEFLAIVQAAKRIENILKDQALHPLDAAHLAHPAEAELYRELNALTGEVEAAVAAREYERSLRRINELAGALDRLFVEVLVMDPDEAVRRNRLALLQAIHTTLSRAGKITEMVVEKARK